jgi:hypothetical protein
MKQILKKKTIRITMDINNKKNKNQIPQTLLLI